jgi:hypothetical protein
MMTLNFNGMDYPVTSESIYTDIKISELSLDEAVTVARDMESMDSYVFNLNHYSDMIVQRRIIIIDGAMATLRVQLREKTAQERLNELLAERGETDG